MRLSPTHLAFCLSPFFIFIELLEQVVGASISSQEFPKRFLIHKTYMTSAHPPIIIWLDLNGGFNYEKPFVTRLS